MKVWIGSLSVGMVLGATLSAAEFPVETGFLRDYAETRGFTLGRPVKAKPAPDGKSVIFLRAQPRKPALRLYEFDVATKSTRELLTPEQVLAGAEEALSPEEKARRERMRISVGGFTDFQISENGAQILLSLSGSLYAFDRISGRVTRLETGKGTVLDPKFSPDGRSVSYVLDNDVYVYDLASKRERRITKGGTELISHGLAEFVAQEEMGRFSGYWWSPDSRSIVYEESDATGVETWYVADPARPDQKPLASFYPRPGRANARVRLGVVPAQGGDTVWLRWDAGHYPYLGAVHWQKYGPLCLTVQTREQDELALLYVDPSTGGTTVLMVERDPAWVNLNQDFPKWLGGDRGFLWESERDGGRRLEWRERSGALKKVVVPSSAGFLGVADADPKTGRIVYSASNDPTESRLFRTTLEGNGSIALTQDPGLHSATFGEGHDLSVRFTSQLHAVPRAEVYGDDGSLVAELPSVAEKPPFVPRSEILRIGPSAGFYTAIVRPREFDAKKRYPVIVHVYGGPHGRMVMADLNSCLLRQWIADQGFIVVSVDGRGTPGRGRDWERAIAGHFGSVPLDDQVAGLKALGERFPELDLARVGVCGWSFGGYMSALAVLKRPDIFRAAAAGAPVVDWLDYDTHYTERYLGLPEQKPEAYREGSLLTYAAGLSRPLLLVHGTSDDNVFFRHTLKLSNALFRAGKEFELLPLTGMTHMTPDPVVQEELYSRIARFFQAHLGEPIGR